jgi:hypothetical protein
MALPLLGLMWRQASQPFSAGEKVRGPVNPMVVGVMQRAVIAIDARVGRQVADSRKLRGEDEVVRSRRCVRRSIRTRFERRVESS